MADEAYQPGACNIGAGEQRKRRLLGYASFAVAFAYIAAVLLAGYPETYVLGSFIFLYGGVLGVLQAQRQFCAGYAVAGRYGFDDAEGSVEDSDARSQDIRQALLLSAKALAAAVFLVSVIYGAAVSV
ncbi:hypothetical protein [Halapricum desulfuricans]|uniref:Putative membrane protein n=1 Tax=Halapricum desulfuricans TaxID=2841257 RepID=A0A897NCA3_9EURY|nr:hypothetical protein [Halapricum desulfuricans]QSG10262.1 putative membrane protein [Halapricum desulfuricans]QSG10641.1 putative membrane protein [Halapricum desulfuricans]